MLVLAPILVLEESLHLRRQSGSHEMIAATQEDGLSLGDRQRLC